MNLNSNEAFMSQVASAYTRRAHAGECISQDGRY